MQGAAAPPTAPPPALPASAEPPALARREVDVTATARVEAVAGRPTDLSTLTDPELRQLELLASKVR